MPILEGFLALVTFGTIGFWVMMFVISCFIIGFLEYRKSFWATVTLIASLFVLYRVVHFELTLITQHPIWTAVYILGYLFVVGPVWAIFKWWRKVDNLAQKCNDLRSEFLRKNGIENQIIPANLTREWASHLSNKSDKIHGLNLDPAGNIIPPHPNDHKEELYLWILLWPWSMVWFVVDEPVRKSLRFIYRTIRTRLVAISEHAFKDIKDDFAPVPPKSDSADQRNQRFNRY